MEIHQVRYFVAVSKALNFTRAAEACNVTQPALTKAIQKLEYELGGELVFRERQLTQLTELGKLVLPTLEKMLAAAETVRSCARDFKHKALAPLKIGLSPCISATLVVDLISEMSTAIPGLQLELTEMPSGATSKVLLEGELNAALYSGTEPLPDRVDQWRLFDEPFVVLMNENHPLASAKPLHKDDLASEAWIERLGCDALSRLWEHQEEGSPAPRILHRGRQDSHLQQMVAAGFGILLAAQHAPCEKGVVARRIYGDPLHHQVQLLAIAGRRYTPALDALIKVVRSFDWAGRAVGDSPQRSAFEHVAHTPYPVRIAEREACAAA